MAREDGAMKWVKKRGWQLPHWECGEKRITEIKPGVFLWIDQDKRLTGIERSLEDAQKACE
jgi:hypothetical protein